MTATIEKEIVLTPKELLTFLVRELVDVPDGVSISESDRNGDTHYQVCVSQDDIGKVIGKQGRIANAIRTVVKAVAMASDKSKVYVEILTPEQMSC